MVFGFGRRRRVNTAGEHIIYPAMDPNFVMKSLNGLTRSSMDSQRRLNKLNEHVKYIRVMVNMLAAEERERKRKNKNRNR
jgi:hypothetical protein